MSTGAVVAAVVVGAGLVIGGVALASSKKNSKGGTTPAPSGGWTRTKVIHPFDRVRASVTAQDLSTVAQAMGVPVNAAGFEQILKSPEVTAAFQTSSISHWAPGDALPSDWPKDDSSAAKEFHVEFVYGGSIDLDASKLPIPAIVWTKKGTAPAPSTTPTAAGYLDLAHASAVLYRGVHITSVPALPPIQGAISLFVWPEAPPAVQRTQNYTIAQAIDDAQKTLDAVAAQGHDMQVSLDLTKIKEYAPGSVPNIHTRFVTIPLHTSAPGDTPSSPTAYLALWTVKGASPPFPQYLAAATAPNEPAAAAAAITQIAMAEGVVGGGAPQGGGSPNVTPVGGGPVYQEPDRGIPRYRPGVIQNVQFR